MRPFDATAVFYPPILRPTLPAPSLLSHSLFLSSFLFIIRRDYPTASSSSSMSSRRRIFNDYHAAPICLTLHRSKTYARLRVRSMCSLTSSSNSNNWHIEDRECIVCDRVISTVLWTRCGTEIHIYDIRHY